MWTEAAGAREAAATFADIVQAARAHGLEVVDSPAPVLDTSGADFVVVHAWLESGDRWILRRPRRSDVVERSRREGAVLEMVAPALSVDVPRFQVATPELVAYRRLAGELAAHIDMEAGGYVWRFDASAPPEPFLDSLAGAIADLHRIEPGRALALGVDERGPVQARSRYAGLTAAAREELDVPASIAARWSHWIEDDSSWSWDPVVVHGDLHPPHILVDDEHRVTGLLDWTEAHVGDPATDFVLQYATLGSQVTDRLLAGYVNARGARDPRMAHRIEDLWSAYPAVIADFARLSGDAGPRALAQSLLDAAGSESG